MRIHGQDLEAHPLRCGRWTVLRAWWSLAALTANTVALDGPRASTA